MNPKLRWPLEVKRQKVESEDIVILSCPQHISPAPLALRSFVMPILAELTGENSFNEISKNIKALSENKYLIKETTLYSAFTRLEKNGYITSFSQEAENGKRRTYYQITEAGRVYYREKCEEWQLTKDVIERFIAE